MLFEITKHFLDPHTAQIQLLGLPSGCHIGGQEPGFIFALAPIGQKVGLVQVLLRE